MMFFCLPLLSGILLALSFPKFNLFYFAWFALVPFLLAIYKEDNCKRVIMIGTVTGGVFFGMTLFWVTCLQAFVGLWAYLAWIGVAILQTIFFLIFALWAWYAKKISLINKLIAIPAGFVVYEWLRSLGGYGVTGGGLGYSQSWFLPLLQLASILSVYGISFVLISVNVFIAEVLYTKKIEWKSSLLLGVVLLFVIVFGFYCLDGEQNVSGTNKTAILIQGNISQNEKMDSSLVLRQFYVYLNLTKTLAKGKPDFIIWPETAVPFYLLSDYYLNVPRQELFSVVKEGGINLIFGVPTYLNMNVYNSMVLIEPSVRLSQYNKERLVPFGEYLPFRPLLYPLLSKTGFLKGDYISGTNAKLLETAGLKIGEAICFESTFPDLIRDRVSKGAEVILVITNDAWFFNSAAPYQHLQAGVLRAVENRRYLIQSANSGISAVIDPCGRIINSTSVNEQTVLKGQFRAKAEKSLYTLTGDLFAWICLILVVVYGVVLRKRSAKICAA